MQTGLLFFLSFLFIFSISLGAKPPAGTKISNVAVVTYEDQRGVKYRDESNPVIVIVKEVYGISIEPDYQEFISYPGKVVEIPYTLKNTGNTRDSYTLSVENLPDDDADLDYLQIYLDINNNGVVDPGEPLYDNTNPPTLKPEETISLVLQAQIPTSVSSGNIKVSLNGISRGDNTKQDSNNITLITVVPYGSLEIKKSSNKRAVEPGETISFLIEFRNPSDNPVRGASVQTDFDNDNNFEERTGVLIYDELPSPFSFVEIRNVSLSQAIEVFKGDEDTYWKDSLEEVKGELKYVGLLIPDDGTGALQGNGFGSFSLLLKVKENAEAGSYENVAFGKFRGVRDDVEVNSNKVIVEVKLVPKIILDDTDDGQNKFTGNNSPQDPDDLTILEGVPTNVWIEVKNEVWNLSNSPQIIDLTVDTEKYPLPEGTLVEFRDLQGRPFSDTNGNGYADVGLVQPGEKKEFITRIKLPDGNYSNILIGLKALLFIEDRVVQEDYTFILLKKAQPSLVRVEVKVKPQQEEILKGATLIVYEYNTLQDTEPSDYRIFNLNEEGRFPPEFYSYLKDDKFYRIAIVGEYKDLNFTLSPFFKKEYLFAVNQEGQEKCWDKLGNEVPCDSPKARIKVRFEGGQTVLILPLDPAGYVYDAVTGEKINGACVTFYRCIDATCESYEQVDPKLLDVYPDGKTPQENPQVSGPTDVNGNPIKVGNSTVKGDGGFQFTFRAFTPELRGWYFIEVTYDCGLPAADPTLKEKYLPVKLKRNAVWTPESGKPYTGERFFVDENFDQTKLMAIPLTRASTRKLVVQKRALNSVSSVGEFVKWELVVENPNDFAIKNVKVYDILPGGLRYKKGTTYLDEKRFKDPQISPNGRTLTWNIGTLDSRSKVRISFYTVVTPGISEGKIKNLAYARGCIDDDCFLTVESNEAFAFLKIRKGIFSEKAYIIGKVFIDKNKNGIQEEGEIGVQGVKIYLEDGRYVVTDKEGKYHFDNVNPGMHVVKLDRESIPKGLKPIPLNNRFAGDEDSVFVDLYPGDFFKVDFALIEDSTVHEAPKKLISIKRYIKEFVKDANTGDIYIKNVLVIKNVSSKAIGDSYYEEYSPYEPIDGTVYINGSSYDNPEPVKNGFRWNLMLIRPGEVIELSWLSYVPIKYSGSSSYSFEGDLIGEGKVITTGYIPVTLSQVDRGKYLLRVNINGELDKEVKETLQVISIFLRESKEFKQLILEVEGSKEIKEKVLKVLRESGVPGDKVTLR